MQISSVSLQVASPGHCLLYVCRCSLFSWKFLQDQVQLGGTESIVEIDESIVARIGGSMYTTATGKGWHLEFIEDRSTAALLPIIDERHVLQGSRIYSDQWSAYDGIGIAIGQLAVNPPVCPQNSIILRTLSILKVVHCPCSPAYICVRLPVQ